MGANLPSSSRHGRRRAPMAEINVTPLVDVMLVLLIIFMVTAPLLVAGVPIDLPESRAGALDQQAKPVQVAIDGRGVITVDDAPVSEAELPALLTRIAAQPEPAEGRNESCGDRKHWPMLTLRLLSSICRTAPSASPAPGARNSNR